MSESESDVEEPPRKRERVLELKGGSMEVKYVGYKKRGDREMIMELCFTFEGEESIPKIVGRNTFKKKLQTHHQIIFKPSFSCLIEFNVCNLCLCLTSLLFTCLCV